MRGEAVDHANVRGSPLPAVRAFDLETGIRRRGLEFEVGNRGRHLTARQQAAADLVRGLLRRPDILIVDGAAAPLEGGLGRLVAALEPDMAETSLLAVAGPGEAAGVLACLTVARAGEARQPEPETVSG